MLQASSHGRTLPSGLRSQAASCVIGVDFDNTIISYDDVLHRVALERGLIHPGVGERKREIRDTVRQLADGEIEWQRLQAIVYGPRIGEATLIDGVQSFFALCRQQGTKVFIISHKTEFAHYDETRTNLRQVALQWMAEEGFFSPSGLGLSEQDVFFEATRREKIARLVALSCTHFIDDLEETFLEDSFPENVAKILYSPLSAEKPSPPGVRVASTWKEICDLFFNAQA